MQKPVLWTIPDSSYSLKTCLAPFGGQFDFDMKVVEIFDDTKSFPKEFLELNPLGTIPVLQKDFGESCS